MNDFDVRWVSPNTFPSDPRYEQMRTKNILPTYRVFGPHKRDQSRLLSLPDEILWRITEFIAGIERGRYLSQFSLVHRECRQLARPHQFADVFILRSEKSWGFLRHLLREATQDESESAGWCLNSSIGDCIRSISIDVDFGISTCTCLPEEAQAYEKLVEYWHPLIDDLSEAVETAMPYLERVFWIETDELEVQPRLLKAILQHSSSELGRLYDLAFADYKFKFYEELDQIHASVPSGPMRLRSFALGDDENSLGAYGACEAYLAETILRRSGQTLESCVWNSKFDGMLTTEDDGTIRFRDGLIEFPKLRKFWAYLRCELNMGTSVLESFLAAPLESFGASAKLSSIIIDNNLVDEFPLPHLRTFAIPITDDACLDDRDYAEKVLSLARLYAQQIEELFIYALASPDQLVSHFSSNNYCNLRSLCFSWGQDPELRVLKAIGLSLTTLEELSFGFQPAANMTGTRQNHVTEYPLHDEIIAAISPLKKLVRLTVFGDEYIADWCGSDWVWHRFFKEHVWFNQGRSFAPYSEEPFGGNHVDGMWGHNMPGDERSDTTRWLVGWSGHQHPPSAVVDISHKYATALPSLRGFVCGRVAVEITRRKGTC